MAEEQYMRRALELAAKGRGFTGPNPMVGAVIVKDGRIVGEGCHEHVGEAHAEINALSQAGAEARDATMYLTLEPCVTQGRTPPCAPAVAKAGIKEVVLGAKDPNPKVAGRGITALQKAGVSVIEGILSAEAKRLNEAYNKYITTGTPFVTLKVAMSLDGRVATSTGDSRWITGDAARQRVHEMRSAAGALITGAGTIKADNPSLTVRLDGRQAHQPIRIVLDTEGSISMDSEVVKTAKHIPTIVATTNEISLDKTNKLARADVEVLIVGMRSARVPIRELLAELGEREIASVMVEAGSALTTSFIEENLFDKIVFFIAPKLVGSDGIPFYKETGLAEIKGALKLDIRDVERFGDDIMIETYRKGT